MSKKQSTPKSKSNASTWNQCERCKAMIPCKEVEEHNENCPPNVSKLNHSLILDQTLYGKLDMKSNDGIKGLTDEQIDFLVFTSQSAMKLCGMAIGESVLVSFNNSNSFIANVWPTLEKSSSTILLTKNAIERNNLRGEINNYVTIRKHKADFIAKKIQLVILNAPKALEISNDLQCRLNNHYQGHIVMKGNVLTLLYYGKLLKFEVKSIISTEDENEANLCNQINNLSINTKSYEIIEKTHILIYKHEESLNNAIKSSKCQLLELAGLGNEIEEVKMLRKAALEPKSIKNSSKIEPCRGILLYGQSGTGKTSLAKALAYESRASVIEINSTRLYSSRSGSIEENAQKLFEEARNSQPAIVLMDEIDVLCPARTSRLTEAEKRIVACILNELDAILGEKQVFILATTSKVDSLDGSLRRCGRFDREIEIPVPNPKSRLEILQQFLGSTCKTETIQQIAFDTHGFVGADLKSLCSTANLHARGNILDYNDFKFALSKVRPSAMREVQVEVPNVKWTDVGGQQKLKLMLKQCVEWPLKHAESFERLGVRPPRGILMYGPPGCSKTMIAKALATESSLNFISIKGPELFSKWVGESEKAIREVFRKARQVAPSIIFFDEIDALGGERSTSAASASNVQERVLAQLLTELDGFTDLGDVTILAATNRPDRIDNALLRPGRLDRIVYVPLPDEATRLAIFQIKIARMPVHGVDAEWLAMRSDRYSGAEITAVCHEAAMMALEEDLDAVCVDKGHFLKAFELITPRTPAHLIAMYENYRNE